jgi:hypothetical protein
MEGSFFRSAFYTRLENILEKDIRGKLIFVINFLASKVFGAKTKEEGKRITPYTKFLIRTMMQGIVVCIANRWARDEKTYKSQCN